MAQNPNLRGSKFESDVILVGLENRKLLQGSGARQQNDCSGTRNSLALVNRTEFGYRAKNECMGSAHNSFLKERRVAQALLGTPSPSLGTGIFAQV